MGEVRSTRAVGAAVAVALVVALGACSTREEPAIQQTSDPAIAEIRAARSALGKPAVALAEAVLALEGVVDAVRHEVPRGEEMASAAASIDTSAEELRAVAEAAERALDGLADDGGNPAVAAARAAVEGALADARAAAGAAEAERAALAKLAEIDVRLDAAVAAWDNPGSRTQRRAELTELAAQLTTVADEVSDLEPQPSACPELWERRAEWAQLLAERSLELAELAGGSTGEAYDQLRAELAENPYGASREEADAADHPCWERESDIALAAAAASEHVEALEAALNR